MKAFWLGSAKIDLQNFVLYFSDYGFLETKTDFCNKVDRVIRLLEKNPYLGAEKQKTNVREFVISKGNCILVYMIANKNIYILRLFDTRQNPENKFK